MRRACIRALLPLAALATAAAPLFALTPARAADQHVAIAGRSYQPADVSVALNERVTWFNQTPESHTVTSDSQIFDSGGLAPYGGGYQVMFQRAGTFPYHCAFHPEMRGVVRVAGGGGGTTPPPPRPVTTIPGTPPTTARPSGGTTPPPTAFATTTTLIGAGSTTSSSSTSSTSSSSTTSTTSLFSPPTTTRASASNDKDEDNKRRIFGGIAAALAAAGTLATIFVARRPVGPPPGYDSY